MKPGHYVVVLALLACRASFAQVSFTDVSASAGTGISEGTARGIAWADFNNDGWEDLFVPTAGNTPNKLYLNNGNGTFTEVAALVGLNDMANTITCSWTDFDNDGDIDLVTTATAAATRLWRNNRNSGTDTTFTAIEGPAGVSMTGAQMPAWADYNKDGFIDFYSSISNSAASTDALYRNNGDGTFTNVADSAGVNHQVSGVLEQAIHWGDFNKDGYPDLFIGNLQTTGVSYLHRNNGDGTFTEVAATLGFQQAGRGAQWVDYNNDGLWDFSYAAYAGGTAPIPIKLFRNNGDGSFTDVASISGMTDAVISWGVVWADYDNDGYEDVFVAVSGASTACLLYRNNGNGTFTNATAEAGLTGQIQLSAAWADFNNDGWMDLYTAGSATNGNHLYLNNGDSTRHWLQVKLVGTQSTRAGIGAQVDVVAGALQMMRDVNTGVGYRSQSMLRAHFGLGLHTVADTVRVRWPSGNSTVLTNVPADQIVEITEAVTPIAPNIVVSPDSLTLVEDGLWSDTLLVRNIGSAVLVVDTIMVPDSIGAFPLRLIPSSFTVAPGDSQEVVVIMDIPVLAFDFLDSLHVHSNDPNRPVVTVFIRGDFPSDVSVGGDIPGEFQLLQNYPNPFNPSTAISFQLSAISVVSLRVYDILGRELASLVDEVREVGEYAVAWDATNQPSGVYFARLTTAAGTRVIRMMLVR